MSLAAFGFALLRILDRLTDWMVKGVLSFALLLGLYALWDAGQVYQSADAENFRPYRPTESDALGFAELRAINPDVFAWLTVDGTPIDYPVVQTDNNETYLTTDAQGRWALSGAIFLDYRSNPDFTGFNSVLYGHHMEKKRMFGALSDFADPSFFAAHPYGTLYFNGQNHRLELFALVLADAYDELLFTPNLEGEARRALLERIDALAVCRRSLAVSEQDRLVLMSTCTETTPNGRYLLVGRFETEEIIA